MEDRPPRRREISPNQRLALAAFDRRVYPGLLQGNSDAWGDFYDHYAGRLEWYFERNNVYLEGDREELLQETMAAVFASLPRFDPERGSLRGWVYGVARNLMLRAQRDYADRYRKETTGDAALARSARDPVHPIGEPEGAGSPRIVALRHALGQLSERDQEILALRVNRIDATWEELAGELGTTVSAAKMRHKRALDRLREGLVEGGVDASAEGGRPKRSVKTP